MTTKEAKSIFRSLEDLNRYKDAVHEKKTREARSGKIQVIISLGSCGIAAGALQTLEAIQEALKEKSLADVQVSKTGCDGQCKEEPLVRVVTADRRKVTYGKVTPKIARRIVEEHILGGQVVQEYVI